MTDELSNILAGGEEFAIDFSGVEEKDNLPVGSYDIEVEKAEVGKSKNGNRKVALTLVVTDGTFKGRKVFMHPVLEGGGLWKTKQTLRALGENVDDANYRLNPNRLVGKRAVAVVDEESQEYGSAAELKEGGAQTLASI